MVRAIDVASRGNRCGPCQQAVRENKNGFLFSAYSRGDLPVFSQNEVHVTAFQLSASIESGWASSCN